MQFWVRLGQWRWVWEGGEEVLYFRGHDAGQKKDLLELITVVANFLALF